MNRTAAYQLINPPEATTLSSRPERRDLLLRLDQPLSTVSDHNFAERAAIPNLVNRQKLHDSA